MKVIDLVEISEERFTELSRDAELLVLDDGKAAMRYWLAGGLKHPFLVCHEEYHLNPKAYAIDWDVYCIGVNCMLYMVDAGLIKLRIPLPCRFYDIVYATTKAVVVFHEIGFLCVDCFGKILWDRGGDLINSWRIENGVLTFEKWSGECESIVLL